MQTLTSAPPQQAYTYDLTLLHDMAGNNQEFVISLIQIFLDTIPVNSLEMEQACSEGRWDMVSKLAHKLKSTVDMMRISSIVQDIRTIELDAKNQVNKEMVTRLVYKVNEIIQLTAVQLKEEFNLA
jgi:HPt (histidine-containing phosphotransfer) domain-containing protein